MPLSCFSLVSQTSFFRVFVQPLPIKIFPCRGDYRGISLDLTRVTRIFESRQKKSRRWRPKSGEKMNPTFVSQRDKTTKAQPVYPRI